LFLELTALENILAGLHVHIDGSFLGIVMGLGEAREAEREGIARARRLLDLMDLGVIADTPVKDLSGGQQRMVEIVRTLATEPPLLLLDEPVVGLSPPMRDRMMEIIRRLAGEEGIGIILIEHIIDLVMSGSDVIVVLSSGEVIAEGTPEEIRQNREVLEAYLGHA
jgi:branched-chain amino acid transport system ATP-binding protein